MTKNEGLEPPAHPAPNCCFGCGQANSAGLRLEFVPAADGAVVSMPAVARAFEGHPGYLHGGIIATLLDEAMSKAVHAQGWSAMTRHMEIDYLRPVPSAAPLRVEGRVMRSEGRKHWAESRILSERGTALAEARGVFIEIRPRTILPKTLRPKTRT